MTLKDIVERSETRLGRTFDLVTQTLIAISLISFSIDTLPNLSPQTQRTLRVIEVVTVAVFTVEYLTRLAVADSKHRAPLIAKEEIVLFVAVTAIVLYLAAVGIYFFENESQPQVFSSVFHSLWWAVATLTTVGYGNAYPVTAGGRIFTFVVLVIGSASFPCRRDVQAEPKG